jgi:N-acetylglucosamine-6-phosphate deacetylase
MSAPQEITARHFATGQPIRLVWADGKIVSVSSIAHDSAVPNHRWLAPPLLDLQVNGYAGIDFQQDNLTGDDLLRATDGLARDGCARWLLTLITDDWTRLLNRLRHLRAQREQSARLRHAIVGWHIEGPFLSSEPGFRGAHDGSVMIDPSSEYLCALREITGNDPVLLTLAPERAGAIAAIRTARELGFVVSLGHTDASAPQLAAAIQAGARAFTHLGNGCPRTLDRHDNILWRVLETQELIVSLIPDAIHVSPSLFRLIHRLLDPARVYYVSDAMSAAGAPPGRYPLGRLQLEVGEDQVVRLPGSPNFAGSALRPIDGVIRASQMLGVPWSEAWIRFSHTPATLMKMPAALEAGQPADFCVLEQNADESAMTLATWVRGAQEGPAVRLSSSFPN